MSHAQVDKRWSIAQRWMTGRVFMQARASQARALDNCWHALGWFPEQVNSFWSSQRLTGGVGSYHRNNTWEKQTTIYGRLVESKLLFCNKKIQRRYPLAEWIRKQKIILCFCVYKRTWKSCEQFKTLMACFRYWGNRCQICPNHGRREFLDVPQWHPPGWVCQRKGDTGKYSS